MQVKPESDIPFVRILVQPEEGPLQVSFDNHANRNYWSYHPDTGRPHGTGIYYVQQRIIESTYYYTIIKSTCSVSIITEFYCYGDEKQSRPIIA